MAKPMEDQITGLETELGYLIQFPDNAITEKITGTLYFENKQNKDLNYEQPLVLSGSNVLIPKERLENGPWLMTMNWAYDGKPYTTTRIINY